MEDLRVDPIHHGHAPATRVGASERSNHARQRNILP
jgi:hypothetical protein